MADIAKPRVEQALHADTPCILAARHVLRDRLRTVERWLKSAAAESPLPERTAHQLRVATRRASAALRLFRDQIENGAARLLSRALREIRQAAARTRRADVQRGLLAEQLQGDSAASAAAAIDALSLERGESDVELATLAARARRVVADGRRRLLRGLTLGAARLSPRGPYVMAELAGKCLPKLIAPLVGDPSGLADEDLIALHELRLAAKRARYALEIFENCLPIDVFQPADECLVDAQSRLGSVNDWHEMVQLFGPSACATCDCGGAPTGVVLETPEADALLLAWAQTRRGTAQRDFVAWWTATQPRLALLRLYDFLDERVNPTLRRVPRLANSRRVAANGQLRLIPQPGDGTGAANDSHPHRIAAIDVGSNSVRMVVAETDARTRFRVIEDVRETTRLAGGMFRTGKLSADAMEHALAALRRMRDIAEEHHVDHVRAVGTCAIREARNADRFLQQVEREAGIRIRPISAEYEARLAFSSVANAFDDLNGVRIAVCDLGGGTADVVIGDNGLIEDWYSFPLGAVRLTDQFSDATNPGVYRYREMERAVDDSLLDGLGEDRRPVDFLVGTGGTLTTLARISIRRGGGPHPEGRFPFAVRGYELSLSEVSDILEWLKAMSHDERRRVPGVNERRSEIIVAGVCVIERLMKAMHTERLRVHDGGIRDGLLMEMIDELHLSRPQSPHHADEVLPAVRRFAERVGYDVAHSEHVARLALRIFDQLAEVATDRAAAWTRPGAREILEAAAVLHDIGIAIHYQRHHKHSYDMITHADLAPLARRQVELIANVARYHRGSGPRERHRGFRRLSIDDQHLVRDLVGILRIADGLDRAHDQSVRDVVVDVTGRRTRFLVQSSSDLTRENLAAARKKANVFRTAFDSRPRIERVAGEQRPTGEFAELEELETPNG